MVGTSEETSLLFGEIKRRGFEIIVATREMTALSGNESELVPFVEFWYDKKDIEIRRAL